MRSPSVCGDVGGGRRERPRGAGTAHLLIYAGDITLESLLVDVVERMGHEAVVLGAGPSSGPVSGDALLVDPTAAHATAWAQALRSSDSALPVVAIGLDPLDPDSLGLTPAAVVLKPFALDELRTAIARALVAR